MQSKDLTALAVSRHKLSTANIQLDLLNRLLQFELHATQQTEETTSVTDDDLENLLRLVESAADYVDLLFRHVSIARQIPSVKHSFRPR